MAGTSTNNFLLLLLTDCVLLLLKLGGFVVASRASVVLFCACHVVYRSENKAERLSERDDPTKWKRFERECIHYLTRGFVPFLEIRVLKSWTVETKLDQKNLLSFACVSRRFLRRDCFLFVPLFVPRAGCAARS